MARLSDAGIALTRALYESLNAGDLDAFFALLDPEVELREEFLAPDVAVYHGHDGIREWLARSSEAMSGFRFEPGHLMRVEDAVVIPVKLTATGTGSGAEVSANLVHLGRMHNGRITLLAAYPDLQGALKAAGAGVEVAPEPWDSPEGTELREELQAELIARYGHDTEPGEKPRAQDAAAFLIARDPDGRPVGCGALRALGEDHAVELKRMYVRPQDRGRGLGWVILAALEAEAERLGFAIVRLETGDLQHEAMALYRAAGYREIPCYGAYAHGPVSRCFERRL
jgi:ketosteroid isomerase-like protein/GNAT superfamily N-acetyltransferase